MLADVELTQLERLAKKQKVPVSTFAYQLVAKAL